MIETAIIVFREALEIAIVVALLLAATKGVRGRWMWLGVGLAAGVAGSCVVAYFADVIAGSFAGSGEDVFNAVVLLLTAIMVAWTIAWMRRHSAEIAMTARETGARIRSGDAPLYIFATTVAITVLRDGSELVVFLAALRLAGEVSSGNIAGGFVLGIAGGIVTGTLLYGGVMWTRLRSVFTMITVLLAFLAAGLAAQAAAFFVSSGWLPPLLDPLWDMSSILDNDSVGGRFAHSIFGYVAQPSGMQVLAYLVMLSVVCWFGLRLPAARHASAGGKE
ncbi:MAG: FTR1 family protein [Alphaproteobacteria bacterium]